MDLGKIKKILEQSNQEQIDDIEHIGELASILVVLRKIEADIIDKLRTSVNNLTTKDAPEDRMIETLGLSTRVYNRLVRYFRHVRETPILQTTLIRVKDILNVPKDGWREIIGYNSKATAKEIEDKMHEVGFTDFKITLHRSYKHNLVDD